MPPDTNRPPDPDTAGETTAAAALAGGETLRSRRASALGSVSALLGSVALLQMGNGLQGTLLPIRAGLESFGTVNIGVMGSAYFLGFALGCLLGPHAVRRVGHVRVFLAMSAVASAVPLIHTLVVDPTVWWGLRGATGFCFAVLYVVIESWLNERSSNDTRGFVLAMYLVITLTVITIGQMMIVLYDPRSFELFLLASVLVSMAAIPVGFTRASTPAPVETVRVRIRRLYHLSPVGFGGCLAVGLVNGAFWGLAPLFAERAGMSILEIALFTSATVIGGAFGQWPVGRLSDSMDRRKMIMVTCGAAAALGVVLASGILTSAPQYIAVGTVFGFFAFPLYGLSLAHTNDFVDPQEFVEASSGLLLVFAAGAVVGPLAAAWLMSLTREGALYGFTACVHLLIAGFALWRITRRPAPDQRTPFREGLQASQTVSTSFEEMAHRESGS